MKKPTKLAASWMMQHKLWGVFQNMLNLMNWIECYRKSRSHDVLIKEKDMAITWRRPAVL